MFIKIAALAAFTAYVSAKSTTQHKAEAARAFRHANTVASKQKRNVCHANYKKGVAAPGVNYLAVHGWTLVRRVKRGNSWHPAKDHGVGTQAYGTYNANDHTGNNTFSTNYSSLPFDEVLFTSGDFKTWVQAKKGAALSQWYNHASRPMISNSYSQTELKANWLNRKSQPEDPWISTRNHSHISTIVYGEAGWASATDGRTTIPRTQNGANMYVRNSAACTKYWARRQHINRFLKIKAAKHAKWMAAQAARGRRILAMRRRNAAREAARKAAHARRMKAIRIANLRAHRAKLDAYVKRRRYLAKKAAHAKRQRILAAKRRAHAARVAYLKRARALKALRLRQHRARVARAHAKRMRALKARRAHLARIRNIRKPHVSHLYWRQKKARELRARIRAAAHARRMKALKMRGGPGSSHNHRKPAKLRMIRIKKDTPTKKATGASATITMKQTTIVNAAQTKAI